MPILPHILSALLALQTPSAGASSPAQPAAQSNAEMKALFEADQAPRAAGKEIDWAALTAEDARRRKRTMELLEAGALQTGDDYWRAAFIFQHGDRPQDYLLAHTLAIVAAARGKADAAWIAAATLDRYLQSVGHSQVYGTQYMTANGVATQEPYARTIVSDALRQALGVPTLSEQEARRREIEAASGGGRPPQVSFVEPARPKGALSGLISSDDYPAAALQARAEGTVRVKLAIGPNGRVTGCAITRSSGSSALDSATCRLLVARARFTPARDSAGNPTAAETTHEHKWVLPQAKPAN